MLSKNIDTTLITAIVMGDLLDNTPDNFKVTVDWKPVPFKDEVVLGLNVRMEGDGGCNQTICEVFSLKNILPEDLEREIWGAYHTLARKLSFRLFEHDPRRGLSPTSSFPDCPLFDPPYVTLPYTNYLSPGLLGHTTKEFREAQRILTTCPFCEQSTKGRDSVWCGGNVGFAHTHCAPWEPPRY